jgi:hypothetical protein
MLIMLLLSINSYAHGKEMRATEARKKSNINYAASKSRKTQEAIKDVNFSITVAVDFGETIAYAFTPLLDVSERIIVKRHFEKLGYSIVLEDQITGAVKITTNWQ